MSFKTLESRVSTVKIQGIDDYCKAVIHQSHYFWTTKQVFLKCQYFLFQHLIINLHKLEWDSAYVKPSKFMVHELEEPKFNHFIIWIQAVPRSSLNQSYLWSVILLIFTSRNGVEILEIHLKAILMYSLRMNPWFPFNDLVTVLDDVFSKKDHTDFQLIERQSVHRHKWSAIMKF